MAEEELKAVSFLPCVTFWNLSPDLSAWGIRTFVFSKHFGHDEGQVHFLLPLHFLGLWWLLPISLFQIWQWWWGVMTLAVFSLMSRNIVRHAVLQQLWRSTKVIRYLPLCVSSRSLWQKYLTWNNSMEERFLLANGFRGFCPWSAGPIAFRLWWGRVHGGESCSPDGSRKQRKELGSHIPSRTCP